MSTLIIMNNTHENERIVIESNHNDDVDSTNIMTMTIVTVIMVMIIKMITMTIMMSLTVH